MESRNIRELLRRFLLGTADEADQQAVDRWYASFDEEAPMELHPEETAATGDEIWARIEPGLGFLGDGDVWSWGVRGREVKSGDARSSDAGNRDAKSGDARKREFGKSDDGTRDARSSDAGNGDARSTKRIWSLSRPMKVAAMVLLIAGAAGTFLLLRSQRSCQNCPLAYTTIQTGVGQKKKVTIQDGSQLTLDASTTIRIEDDFAKERKVEIVDGQVFFDVKTDAERPFIIRSGELNTTVLGTSFSISAYAALRHLSIGVVSGKVRVDGGLATLGEVGKDEELVYNKERKDFKKIPLDESLTAWQDGRILLNDLSFSEVNAVLKMNFGMELATNDEAIRKTRYTTELLAGMSSLEAVQVLAAIHNLKIDKREKTFFLNK